MERLVKDYGKEFNTVKVLAEDYQTMIQQTGVVNEATKEALTEVISKCMFDPKKAVRLSYLEGLDTNTDLEKEEIKALREEQKLATELFCAKDLQKDIKELIGQDNTVSLLRREKIMVINRKKEIREMSYLPKSIMFMQDPLNNANKDDVQLPTSIFRVQIREDEAEETKEKIIILGFLSLCFDPYKKYYETHHWRVFFRVVPKKQNLISEAEIDIEEDLL